MPPFLRAELPVQARTQHHPIVLLRRTHKVTALLLVVTAVSALFSSWGVAALVSEIVWIAYWRWRTWRAEWIFLTRKRIVRVQGIPETTTTEASLRLDRVSGARLVQTPLGRLFDYGTIELEAPGEHPDVRKLVTIDHAQRFYLVLREVLFGDGDGDGDGDVGCGHPDDDGASYYSRDSHHVDERRDDRPQNYVTAPLPRLPDRAPWRRWPHR